MTQDRYTYTHRHIDKRHAERAVKVVTTEIITTDSFHVLEKQEVLINHAGADQYLVFTFLRNENFNQSWLCASRDRMT